MSNEIKIIIGGDPSGFTKAAREATQANDRLRNSFKDAAAAAPGFANATSKVVPALEQIKQKSGAAGAAVLDFSRIVQDAPFAANNFGSIANNIDPAVLSFGRLSQEAKRLSAETGQNITTFSLLKQSLLGGAGIGLAISTVTSLITAAQMKYGSLGAAIEALTGNLSAAALAQRAVNKTFAEAEGSVAGEIATINSLISISRDETLSKSARGEAMNKLNKEYDAYLPKLTEENISTQAVTQAVDKLSVSLLRQAKIKGLQDLISKETAKQAELLSGSLSDNASAFDNIAAAVKSLGPGTNFFTEKQIAGAKATAKGYEEAEKRIETFNKTLNKLLTEEAVAGTLFDETKIKKKEEDFLKKRLEALQKIQSATKDATSRVGLQEQIFELQTKITIRDAGKNQLSKQEVDQAIQGFQRDLQKEFDNQAIELEAIPKVRFSFPQNRIDTDEIIKKSFTTKIAPIEFKDGVDLVLKPGVVSVDVTDMQDRVAKATGLDKKITIPVQYDIELKLFGKEFADSAKRARDQAKGIQEALFNGIVNGAQEGLNVLGAAFADILSGEGISNVLAKAAQGLLGIIGGILQEVGKEIIKTSALVAALKKALNGLFGPGGETIGFAVGAALIATGALLKNIKFNVPKLAEGGIATRATLGIFGEAGREAIIPLNKLPEMMGKLSTDNQQTIVLNGNLRVAGTDLSLLLQRADGTRSRLG